MHFGWINCSYFCFINEKRDDQQAVKSAPVEMLVGYGERKKKKGMEKTALLRGTVIMPVRRSY